MHMNYEELISNMFVDKKLSEKFKSEDTILMFKEFKIFIEKANKTPQYTFRNLVDFAKIINKFFNGISLNDNNSLILYSEFKKEYFAQSAYKSNTSMEVMAVFLYSKNLLKFDFDPIFQKWKLEKFQYFKPDLLEYFFSKTRCNDCGKDITNKNASFCPKCIKRRTLKIFIESIHNKKIIKNDTHIDTFYLFIDYVLKLRYSFTTSHLILNAMLPLFDSLPEIATKNYNSKNSLSIQTIIQIFNERVDMSKYVGKEKARINLIIYLIKFLEKEKMLNHKNNINEIFVNLRVDESNQIILLNYFEVNEHKKQKVLVKIEKMPKQFQKLLNHYVDMFEIQMNVYQKKNTVKSLKWESVSSRIEAIIKLINWSSVNLKVSSWNEVTEEVINSYLLMYKKQEYIDVLKNNFFNFFQFAKKNKYIFENPVPKFKARSYVVANQEFKLQEHKGLISKIIEYSKIDPTTALLISLCYFHALSSKQISSIKISSINFEKFLIEFNGRPNVYLDELEMKLLSNHITLSKSKRVVHDAEYLFFSNSAVFPFQVSKTYILNKVKKSCGFNPKQLRRAGIQYCAAMFGSEFLRDIFGLSLTHLQRFGEVGDQLIEKIISEELIYEKDFSKVEE